jgi:hypothetical protein
VAALELGAEVGQAVPAVDGRPPEREPVVFAPGSQVVATANPARATSSRSREP